MGDYWYWVLAYLLVGGFFLAVTSGIIDGEVPVVLIVCFWPLCIIVAAMCAVVGIIMEGGFALGGWIRKTFIERRSK